MTRRVTIASVEVAPAQQDRLVAPEAAAKMLGIGRSTLYRMTRRGDIKATRISPNRIGYSLRAINQLMQQYQGA